MRGSKSEERFRNEVPGHKLDRGFFYPFVGDLVQREGRVFKVLEVLEDMSLAGLDLESEKVSLLPISEIFPVNRIDGDELVEGNPAKKRRNPVNADLSEYSDSHWAAAKYRYSVIKPLIEGGSRTASFVEERAKLAGVGRATIYRWLERFKAGGSIAALIPTARGSVPGGTRLDDAVEGIVERAIEEVYLSPQRPTCQSTINYIEEQCYFYQLKPPCGNTVRNRIDAIPERIRLQRRGFKEEAENRFYPKPGSFPGGDYPLCHVQIDHSSVNAIIVDPIFRLPIGRATVSAATDVFSHSFLGLAFTLEAPSVTTVAACVTQAICPKESYLKRLGLNKDWPMRGVPHTIHVDNGSDFRAKDFQDACNGYDISIEYRPPGKPWLGGGVESALKTVLRQMHLIPGSTFENTEKRKGYDSEKEAVMTLEELERKVVNYVCGEYHNRVHSALKVSPLRKWKEGIIGTPSVPGIGLPPVPKDPLTVYLDFLPSFERTIQTNGVTIDGVRYYDEVLNPWINYADKGGRGVKRKMLFKRDPNDISQLWFYEPDRGEYYQIKTFDQSVPEKMTLFELKAAKRKAKEDGKVTPAEQAEIYQTMKENRQMIEDAAEKTKAARRKKTRRESKRRAEILATESNKHMPEKPEDDGLMDGDVMPWGEVL